MNKEYELFGRKVATSTLIALLLFFVGFILIMVVIIPQFGNIGQQREINMLKQTQVGTLQRSLAALNSVSDQRLASDRQLLTSALPANKEVISVFSSIIGLASQVGIQVEGFTIQVGTVYDVDNKDAEVDVSSDTGFPSMNVIVSLTSTDQRQLAQFTDLLYKKFPIARVNKVTAHQSNSSVEISFYYRPYDLSQIQNTTEIPGYTNESLELLKKLRESQN